MPTPSDPTRRRLLLQASCVFATTSLTACGGSTPGPGPAPAPPVVPPPVTPPVVPPIAPPPTSALSRLQAAVQLPPWTTGTVAPTVSQGPSNDATFSFGTGRLVVAAPGNSAGQTLANAPQVWGFRRDRWSVPAAGVSSIGGQPVFPVSRKHVGATLSSESLCPMHFTMEGSAFEILFAGSEVRFTLVVDGVIVAPGLIDSAWSGGTRGSRLIAANAVVRVDFGTFQSRQVSLYPRSSQGACALAFAAGDNVQAWDRSAEPSLTVLADSYGGAAGPNFMLGGPFWEAAAMLRLPHLDLDAIGGTGYAPNPAPGFGNTGDAFPARVAGSVDTNPDMVITAGGINDNNSLGLFPYASASSARAGFEAATLLHFQRLRSALPQSVLVALGPWAPRQNLPTDPVAQSKADAILSALSAAGGHWVFVDNLNGGWRCSSGASNVGTGPWQTGTGNTGTPRGDGNGDLYLNSDGVHPNTAGSLYLAQRLATDLRSALLSL